MRQLYVALINVKYEEEQILLLLALSAALSPAAAWCNVKSLWVSLAVVVSQECLAHGMNDGTTGTNTILSSTSFSV